MRLYLPASPESLAAFLAARTIDGDYECVVADDDSEEGEYLALMTAADLSRESGSSRRVVIVAEVASEGAGIRWRDVEALHADVEEGADPDDDLAWFAPQEANLITG